MATYYIHQSVHGKYLRQAYTLLGALRFSLPIPLYSMSVTSYSIPSICLYP
jgi:hypothetical protein